MAYTAPTASEFKGRFAPAFDAVADARIDAVVAEAMGWVGTNWREVDYKPALNYLTAHMLVKEGVLNSADFSPVGVSQGQVSSESLGDASVTYANTAAGAGFEGSDAEWASTPYGMAYLRLRRANIGGPIVV